MTATKVRGRLANLSAAWRRALLTDDGELSADGRVILNDLKKFCRANESTAIVSPVSRTVDPLASMLAEGRREVYNRVTLLSQLTEKQLLNLHRTDDDD